MPNIQAYILNFFCSEIFEIKTFSKTIFEKLPQVELLVDFRSKLRFSLKTFFPAIASVKRVPKKIPVARNFLNNIYFISTMTYSPVFSDSTHEKPRL